MLKYYLKNKDNQNLTNLNLDFNFTNQMLTSLTKAVKTSAINKNEQDKEQDVFYWSEGSIAVGKDADILITKEIPSLEYICYDFGTNHIQQTLLAGLPT